MTIRHASLAVACFALLTFATACSQPDQNVGQSTPAPTPSPAAQRITSESVVKVAASPVTVSPGQSAEAIVRLTIQNGYHVNANPPTFSYLKATSLEIPTAEGIVAAPVTYPKALEKQFAFAPDKALAVYEGEVELKTSLKADKATKSGERSIPALLRIQACDDQVCYPPGTLELVIPVNIK